MISFSDSGTSGFHCDAPVRQGGGSRKRRPAVRAFTLTEILVVIAIISVLAAILMPVFSHARARAHQTACLSNERQIGVALIQYTADNEERFPNGINQNGAAAVWPAEGWAGQCVSFLKSADVFECPADPTPKGGPNDYPVSYGMNANLVGSRTATTGAPSGMLSSDLTAPSRTIILFEVNGITANVARLGEGAGSNTLRGQKFSAAGNGLDNRLYAQPTFTTSTADHYATGLLGGRLPFAAGATQFNPVTGRHSGAANYVLGDGHALWLPGGNVSSGKNAVTPICAQDNTPTLPSCIDPAAAAGILYASGTASSQFSATFSAK